MEHTLPPPETEKQLSSPAPETTGDDGGLTDIVDKEESSFIELRKGGSSGWTNEKHSLYLKSMEASFVDQLYNSLDTRNWKIENECSLDSTSSRGIYANNNCPSGQFRVLHNRLWFSNPWIQHVRNGNEKGATEESTSCNNTEEIDQNFVDEESRVEIVNAACSKKRKSTYAVPIFGNDQAATSFGHISCNRNH